MEEYPPQAMVIWDGQPRRRGTLVLKAAPVVENETEHSHDASLTVVLTGFTSKVKSAMVRFKGVKNGSGHNGGDVSFPVLVKEMV